MLLKDYEIDNARRLACDAMYYVYYTTSHQLDGNFHSHSCDILKSSMLGFVLRSCKECDLK
jgi:hypothetical protein